MAACGSLQHIFDKPSPLEKKTQKASSFDSWKPNNNPIKAIDDIMFSEMHFTEKNVSSVPSTTTTKHNYQCSSSSSLGMNSENLSMCTEGLGFESFDDVEDLKDELQDHINEDECKQENETTISEILHDDDDDQPKKSSRIKGLMEFPPPISSIGMSGKPWVYLESYRSNGRFILKEVKIPTQELLHACREDGRLKLQFIQSDEEEDDQPQVEERKNGNNDGD